MSKYYCKNCETVYVFKEPKPGEFYFDPDDMCPVCGNQDPDYDLIPIPDYETVEQYEKRTGKPYPDNGLVWYRLYAFYRMEGGEGWENWEISLYGEIKNVFKKEKLQLVIADPPVMPPYDWEADVTE